MQPYLESLSVLDSDHACHPNLQLVLAVIHALNADIEGRTNRKFSIVNDASVRAFLSALPLGVAAVSRVLVVSGNEDIRV